jgi:hypothetical protein
MAVREFHRLAEKQGIAPDGFLPRNLFTYEERLRRIVDVRSNAHQQVVGLVGNWLGDDDVRLCQLVGEAAHQAGFEAVLAPSAAGPGEILAIFLDQLLPDSVVRAIDSERWDDVPT